ncbi:PTS transporter subunit EIIC [Streptococcus gallolyticus subsp. gallolyticus]|uniref:PTS transporter subunit EIIC n=1 Tax=Streptococcus gallolyticus TaxID=315405 RepID=UPI00228402CF|nr:PTS transporter subunit EIIC [Streptococcus gallolyticus]MCY7151673.1 PTS transporter subunit EIIC [Streptococcus gallolyticus subsp. gallolyticus]
MAKYEDISKNIEKLVGGRDNILHVTHCATRLRLVLKDNNKADMQGLENVRLVKGVFVAGNQLQMIFGAGLVNNIYDEFSNYIGISSDTKIEDVESQNDKNLFQRFMKALSDVFIEIMPSILAAALLMGLGSLLTTEGLFGSKSIVEMYPSISGINRIVQITSGGIFDFLPMIVAYSAVKRFGGRPALGLAIGAIMMSPNLANAYSVASGTAEAELVNVFGLNIELVGFQGGIIIALMIGYVVAFLDKKFNKILPDMLKFVLSPMLTMLISSFLLFTIIGPLGRELGNSITASLLWATEHLGVFGYMVFAGIQQLIVITGLHHTFGAIEAQLIQDTGRDFLNPLMSVAMMAQGGGVLGFLLLNWNNNNRRSLSVSAFTSILFGITEPALFGVNIKYRYPLVGGCLAGAVAGAYVYFAKLKAVGYGTTVLPGFTIVDPANHGYINYIVAHLIALIAGIGLTLIFSKLIKKEEVK